MKEIGGYIEFEHFHGMMLHEDGIKLDSGRSCLAYLIQLKNIQKILLPSFLCDAVFDLCKNYKVQLRFYQVDENFQPTCISPDDNEYLYLVNYYGQLQNEKIINFRDKFKHIIVDNTQAYFNDPIPCVDTIYTCRKFFGVPDGGILYSDRELVMNIEQSVSWNHMEYILGRFECSAADFYSQSVENNNRLTGVPIRRMSKLTENLLHGIDYEFIKSTRNDNYNYLSERLGSKNLLKLNHVIGPFAYPFMVENGKILRKKLIEKKIYVPILWPNVENAKTASEMDRYLAKNILPLPCDQRYAESDMQTICDLIESV